MTPRHDRPDDSVETTRLTGSGPEPETPGAAWGDLVLRGELGRGGFGRVFRAWDPALAREVALKIIRLKSPDQAASVLREGRMLARVRHPHVVTVHAARQIGEEVGLAMELVDGRHLGDLVRQQGPMSAEEAAVVGLAVLQALAAVHAAGLLHRDVKARNVMREAGGRIVLMDFGAGVELGPGTADDRGIGTPVCMAPEVLLGASATLASDLYSVAVLLYFLVTGDYPVQGPTAVAIAHAHAAGRRRLLADARPDLPDGFVRAVERGLARDPADRYSSAGAFLAALTAAMPSAREATPVVPAPAPAPALAPTRGWGWRRVLAAAGGGLAAAWLLGLLTSTAYNTTLRIGSGFSTDTPLTWLSYGVRMLIPFLGPALLTVLALYVVRAAWRIAPALVPPIRSLQGRVEDLTRQSRRRLVRDGAASEAQYLLLAQVAGMGVLLWTFRDVIGAFASFADVTEPATMALLGGNRPNAYRIALTVAITLMALGWRAVLTSPGARSRADRPVILAGIGATVLMVLLLELPYRLTYHSERPVVAHGRQCCFELGRDENVNRALLYCPQAQAPRIFAAAASEVSPSALAGTSLFWTTAMTTSDDGRTTCVARPR